MILEAGVGEKRVLNLLALREVGERAGLIVTQRGDTVAELADRRGLCAQLHELGFAVGSPIGGADEEDPQAFRTAQ